jgi:hypothetical protein
VTVDTDVRTHQVVVDVNDAEEVAIFSAWVARWREHATVSENEGCGCCVNIWVVSAPQEAFDELPGRILNAAPR